jgi:hypothetical protein
MGGRSASAITPQEIDSWLNKHTKTPATYNRYHADSFIADCTLIQALEKRSVSVPCSKGRILFKQGEAPIGLYFLKTGKASLILKTEEGVGCSLIRASFERNQFQKKA